MTGLHGLFEHDHKFFCCPIGWGWYSEHQVCLTPLHGRKYANSSVVNRGPLSETSCSGKPYKENKYCRSDMVLIAVVTDIMCTSGYVEWASMTIRYIFPMKGPAKSRWTCCHRIVGQIQGCEGDVQLPEPVWQLDKQNRRKQGLTETGLILAIICSSGQGLYPWNTWMALMKLTQCCLL